MYQRFIPHLAVVTLILSGSAAFAQCSCGSSPGSAPSYSTYYAPAGADYTPAPYVSYYTPQAAPVSYVSYYAPAVTYAPTPYVSYYAPASPYVASYSPAVIGSPVVVPYRTYYGVPGRSIYGTPQVYVPGEPVRNVLRSITP